MEPGVEIINGFEIVRQSNETWPADDPYGRRALFGSMRAGRATTAKS